MREARSHGDQKNKSTSFLGEFTRATNNQQVEQVGQPFDMNVFIFFKFIILELNQ
jgi:hypothetical protein